MKKERVRFWLRCFTIFTSVISRFCNEFLLDGWMSIGKEIGLAWFGRKSGRAKRKKNGED